MLIVQHSAFECNAFTLKILVRCCPARSIAAPPSARREPTTWKIGRAASSAPSSVRPTWPVFLPLLLASGGYGFREHQLVRVRLVQEGLLTTALLSGRGEVLTISSCSVRSWPPTARGEPVIVWSSTARSSVEPPAWDGWEGRFLRRRIVDSGSTPLGSQGTLHWPSSAPATSSVISRRLFVTPANAILNSSRVISKELALLSGAAACWTCPNMDSYRT